MKRQFLIVILLLITCLFCSKIVNAQDLQGATKNIPPVTVYLTWPADTSGLDIKYNIYRKNASDLNYPTTPINSIPIAPITNCADFQAVIPSSSPDWSIIANAFYDTVSKAPLANPCTITGFTKNSSDWKRAMLLAQARPSIAIVMGQGYMDKSGLVLSNQYKYQIKRISGGIELPLTGANEITITAGVPDLPPAPTNIRIVIGDAMLQILWNKPLLPKFASFNVYRSLTSIGPYQRVNDADVSADITLDIDSNSVTPLSNGYTDFQRWDSVGNATSHLVNGIPISGPENGTIYYYKAALKDLLGNEGPLSSVVSGTPVDKTPPATPTGLIVTPVEINSGFEIKWPKVRYDVMGHFDKVSYYKVYRYENPTKPDSGETLVTGDVYQPSPGDSLWMVYKYDSTSGLRSDCREKIYYYRVEAYDSSGNISRRSSPVGGALKDTTRPPIPKGISAEGFDDYIRVKWKLNFDCDTNIYLIYRAKCDWGAWVPCVEKRFGNVNWWDTLGQSNPPNKKPKDCGGPFTLVGTMTQSDAEARASGGETYFDDHTVPAGDPTCWAYLVKAQDLAQNLSGEFPIPDVTVETVVCQRLRDRTPPPPGIISGLFALDSAIRVDFIGQPIQDIAAYHVYRSDNGEHGTYNWVGGMTVEPPPGVGIVLTSPYHAPPIVGCSSIPLKSNPYMSAGTFIDKKTEPKQIYWYKVLGVDQNGNESSIDSATGISTFTFTSKREAAPDILSITSTEDTCALLINWSPSYDASAMMGFIIFRSTNHDGPYYQLDNVIKGNSFANNSVARNVLYWYRIAILKKDGSLTRLSEPKSAIHP
jgi:hypothetical protein